MAAVLALEKPLIFSCGKVVVPGGGGEEAGQVEVVRGEEAFHMLNACSLLVDVAAAQCAVPADKERELATIGEKNLAQVNRTVAAALAAGSVAALHNVAEVDAFSCGEPGPLRVLASERVFDAFLAACAAGQLAVLVELQQVHSEAVAAYLSGEGGNRQGEWQPMWTASHEGRCAVVEWLISEVGAVADVVRPHDAVSAVTVAAEFGHLEVVHVLIEAGANVNRTDGMGGTPLIMAAQKGYLEVARKLVEAGANVSHVASRSGPHEVCQVTHRQISGGATALINAAQLGFLEVVRMLLEAGAEVDQVIDGGATALYMAAQNGYLEVARALIGAGANVDRATDSGYTPLVISAQSGHLAVVRELMKADANVHHATKDGDTSLWRAAANGRLEVVHLLVEAGARLEQAMHNGMTPLFGACQGIGHGCHPEAVRVLAGLGASVDTPRVDGLTPLLLAAHQGYLEVVRILVDSGADKSVQLRGDTAMSFALQNGHSDVVELLLATSDADRDEGEGKAKGKGEGEVKDKDEDEDALLAQALQLSMLQSEPSQTDADQQHTSVDMGRNTETEAAAAAVAQAEAAWAAAQRALASAGGDVRAAVEWLQAQPPDSPLFRANGIGGA